jgi:hypothetical protein
MGIPLLNFMYYFLIGSQVFAYLVILAQGFGCNNCKGGINDFTSCVGGSQGSIISITTVLQAGQSGVQILVGERDFYFLQTFQTGSGAYPASCSMGTGVLFQR